MVVAALCVRFKMRVANFTDHFSATLCTPSFYCPQTLDKLLKRGKKIFYET